MRAYEAIVDILTHGDHKGVVYIAKNSSNLDFIRQYAMENADLGATTSRIYLVHPFGLDHIRGDIDEVYADYGCTGEEFIREHLSLAPDAKIVWCNPITMKIEKDLNK